MRPRTGGCTDGCQQARAFLAWTMTKACFVVLLYAVGRGVSYIYSLCVILQCFIANGNTEMRLADLVLRRHGHIIALGAAVFL